MEKTLKSIDDKLSAENIIIGEARARVIKLREERDEVARELERQKRQEEMERKQAVGQIWIKEHPEEHAVWLKEVRRRHQEAVIEGWLDGWWDFDEDYNPIPLPITFTLADFDGIKNPMLAHAMHKAELFPSVNQARKNGWNIPLTTGEWKVGKRKRKIIIKES